MTCTYFISCGIRLSMSHLSMGHVTTKNSAQSKGVEYEKLPGNGKTIVVYTSDELATLERLPGANREMSNEEITAAALADPDTISPLEDDIFLTGKRGREALAELFPPEIAEGLLASR